jgi:pimeloyl-ACP methyl ester carboxylesterase
MGIHRDLEKLALIQPEERDYNLRLQELHWGADLKRWQPNERPARHLSREIPVHEGHETTKLCEYLIPFPSAPIYGINRKTEYGLDLPGRPNMHTLRVLKRPRANPVRRLFILYHGLNETDSLKIYYRLADWILEQQSLVSGGEGAACMVIPFPGHLMHASFHGPFSETPLARYLTDAGDLFRQFLRYMVEMRWLLSMVADTDVPKWMVGGELLDERSRVCDMHDESALLYEMSTKRLERANKIRSHQTGGPVEGDFDLGQLATSDQIESTCGLLRWVLDRDAKDSRMHVHVAGYSLGGFLAQSVFFAWPQIVSSCTTICSGGELSAISPTAFAQPEEWQSVLHALRPEMSNSMLQGRLGDDVLWEQLDEREERKDDEEVAGKRQRERPVDMVAGMPLERFGYFQRIFEQVFLQEDNSSYKERLSEYGLRMLFISGGEDPIIPPANVLDASPKEGTTMLSIAGMTHFLNLEPKKEPGRREQEQREFWLPEAGRLIARAAVHSEQVHEDEQRAAEELRLKRPQTRLSTPESVVRMLDGVDRLESSDMFEAALDWVLDAVGDEGGWLIVCRNSLPAAFIDPREFTRWGAALHHHDVRIQQYRAGLRRRAHTLRGAKPRTTLVVPKQLRHWFVDLSARFDPHSDGPAGRMTIRSGRERMWLGFEQAWTPCIRMFYAGDVSAPCEIEPVEGFVSTIAEWQAADARFVKVTHLPDVWIGIKAEAGLTPATGRDRSAMHRQFIEGVQAVIADEAKERSGFKGTLHSKKRLVTDIESEHVRVVQVSAAEFNPRYRGKIERSPPRVARLLAWCAAGLVRSSRLGSPCDDEERGDGRTAPTDTGNAPEGVATGSR